MRLPNEAWAYLDCKNERLNYNFKISITFPYRVNLLLVPDKYKKLGLAFSNFIEKKKTLTKQLYVLFL